MTPYWALALVVTVPCIAGLHRFAASYGYRGVNKSVALREAGYTALGVAVIEAVLILARFVTG